MVDYSAFEAECKSVLTNEHQFVNFRTRKELGLIVETVHPNYGRDYFKKLKHHFPDIFDHIDSICKIDEIGNPIQHQWADSFKLSSLFLRYLHQACLLFQYIGDLTNKNILEIGGGFGGHAAVVQTLYPSASHTIVDLSIVSQLQKKYLSMANTQSTQSYAYTSDAWKSKKYDVIVSHYCFSELDAKNQDIYLQVIKQTPRGFMICNIINRKSHHKNKIIEWIRAAHPSLKIYAEEPETHRGNYVLVW